MTATNITTAQLEQALRLANKKYKGNVAFERLEAKRNGANFTLRVLDSKGPGHRRGFQGQRLAKACWHAHGDFFESVFAVAPEAKIVSRGGPGAIITKDAGNWQDSNCGSMVAPRMFSEMCDCNA